MGKISRSRPRVVAPVSPAVVAPVVVTTWTAPTGRILSPGVELTISGETGRFKFIRHVSSGDKQWVDVLGGKAGHEKIRSFRPDRVATVHRLKKLR